MKLNEVVSARFGCTFPAKYNKPALDYYREQIKEEWSSCVFIFDHMVKNNDYTLHRDELRYMCENAPDVWSALLEAFLYSAYEDVKKNGRKPKNLVLFLDNDEIC